MEIGQDEMRRIHIALEQAGTIRGAAKNLGYTTARLKVVLREHPELYSYLPNVTPPTPTDMVARPALPVAKSAAELEAEAVALADEQVRKGFAALGVDGDGLAEAVQFANFGRNHFNSLHDLTTGGTGKLYVELHADLRELRRELKDPEKQTIEWQSMLRTTYSQMVSLLLKTHGTVRESAVAAATIKSKNRELKEAKNRRPPAFAPMIGMKVEGNVTVSDGKAG